VQRGELRHQREADADSGRLDRASAREGLEDRLLLGVWHARAVVVHAEERTGAVGRDRNLDGRACGSMALGVRNEVLHDALELGWVDARANALGLHVDLPAVGPACDDAAYELGEVGVLEVDTQPSVPEPVHVEEIVEQPLEPRGLACDEADHLLPSLVGQGGPALAQGDGEAEDGGERRAQLVGDRGEDVLPDLLDALALGDVLGRPDHSHRVAGAVEDHAATTLHDPLASVPEDGTVCHLEGVPFLERHGDGRAYPISVARMDSGKVGLVVQLAALGLEVVDPVELVRPRDAVAGDVPLPAADVGEGLRLGEPDRGLAERLGGLVPLGDRGAEREQADGGDGEEALEDLHCHRLVAAAERHVVRDHAGDAERGDRDARRDRAELCEADGCPEKEGEEEVRVAPESAEEDERREAGERREHHRALGEAPCRDPKGRTSCPDQDQRCDEQGSRRVAEPPEDPARSVGRRGRRVRERKHGDAVRRRHRGRDGRGAGEPDHVLDALEGLTE